MSTFHGNGGTAKIGSNAIAEIKSWSVTTNAETADDTAMGDTWGSHLIGVNRWTATITCHWDDTDTNGQESVTAGTSVTLNLYPEGDASGDRQGQGTATCIEEVTTVDMAEVNERAFNLQGSGALTWSDLA